MNKDDKMPFTSHLAELRQRILIILTVLLLVFSLCFTYSDWFVKILIFPIEKDIKLSLDKPYITFIEKAKEASLVFLAPAEALWMNIKVSMVASFVIIIPLILMQIWLFVRPALHDKEKNFFFPFIIISTLLFLVGSFFCFAIILPYALGFLLTYKTSGLTPMLSVGNYMDFTMKFILAFGFVFELPIILIFLTKLGIVTPEKLTKSRKYALVLSFVVAAFLTPTPDAFNQLLMAVPIILLYETGIIASRFFYRNKKEKE
ncbi:MAG: twin-arginine translocase subunit TatC [Candidatus Magnetoovum sp. WYHC-5]|nr:twin-arginine translocase subunit TatC [Candidatus Magnetoovum sp. WYHC-5]